MSEILQKGFTLSITTWHKPGRGELDNVHNLDSSKLAMREVVPIDIANDPIKSGVRPNVLCNLIRLSFALLQISVLDDEFSLTGI